MQPAAKLNFPDTLASLRRHEGVWEGTYRYYDPAGEKTDEHASRLICRFPTTGPYPYHQTNLYRWADGRKDARDFPALIVDGRVRWDNALIKGWAADVALDEFTRTVMLHWVRKDMPEAYLYEMIQLSDCGRYRSRVWQWFADGRLTGRTLIDEHRVSDSWADYPV